MLPPHAESNSLKPMAGMCSVSPTSPKLYRVPLLHSLLRISLTECQRAAFEAVFRNWYLQNIQCRVEQMSRKTELERWKMISSISYHNQNEFLVVPGSFSASP